jgi:acyl carrier protein
VAEQKRIEKEKAQIAEEACQIEQKRLRKEGKSKLTKQELIEQEYLILEKFEGDKSKVLIFIKVQKIISEVLSIDEDYIDLEFDLFDELGNNEITFLKTIVAFEEGFDIEISNEDFYSFGIMQILINYIHQAQASS